MSKFTYEDVSFGPRWWRYGGPIDFWISHHEMVEGLIKVGDLKPIQPRRPWPGPCPGGLKMPHVHFGEDVFQVGQKQWTEFSTNVVKEMASRLTDANTIRFGELMDLVDITEAVGFPR